MNQYGPVVLRVGLSLMLFWFAAQQLMSVSAWVGFVPLWVGAVSPVSVETLVVGNALVEILLGIFLIFGMYTRTVSALLTLHLAGIALSLGNTPTAVRDWGLAAAFLSLVFTGPGAFSLDAWFLRTTKNTP